MRSFKMPYRGRIMGRLTVAGVVHAPVELFRSVALPVSLAEWSGVTRDLGPEWEVWREHQTPETWVLGETRPIPNRGGRPDDQAATEGPTAVLLVEGSTDVVTPETKERFYDRSVAEMFATQSET